MQSPITDLIAGFQDLVEQVPTIVQPLIIALAGAVPFIEGEGAAGIGVIGGVHPVIAAIAGIVGNLACVIVVVLLGSRIREAAVARRARRSALVTAGGASESGGFEPSADTDVLPKQESKGKRRLRGWLLRFGVPGASLIGPLAVPTQITAATLVASGVNKSWVILWQAIAIVVWTTVITALATGIVTVVTG